MRQKEALVLAAAGLASVSAAVGYRIIDRLRYPYDAGTVSVALFFFGLAALVGAYFYSKLPPAPPEIDQPGKSAGDTNAEL